MYLVKLNESLAEKAEREYANASVLRQQADIDYIAMMSEIDIPTEDEEGVSNEQEI